MRADADGLKFTGVREPESLRIRVPEHPSARACECPGVPVPECPHMRNEESPGPLSSSGALPLAVAVGFEPTVGGYPTKHFECFTFGRSDTPPRSTLLETGPHTKIVRPPAGKSPVRASAEGDAARGEGRFHGLHGARPRAASRDISRSLPRSVAAELAGYVVGLVLELLSALLEVRRPLVCLALSL